MMPNFPDHKYALALHTTTRQLGIAITNFKEHTRSQVWSLERDLAAHLHQNLLEILQPQTWQDLEFIAVAKGPGGFTGTRVGMVTARTLAQQLNIPLFGISTLAAIAQANQSDSNCDRPKGGGLKPNRAASPKDNRLIAVQMNASRGQLFVGIYQPHNLGLAGYLPDTIMTPEQWQATLKQLDSPYQLITAPEKIATTVTNMLDLAYLDWQQQKYSQWFEVLPFYGQHPVT